MKDYLLTAEMNRQRLFLATEQGSSKHSSKIIIIPSPKQKYQAHKWIQNHYSILTTNEGKKLGLILFLPIKEE